MKFSSELSEWLCRSQIGTALHAQLPDANREHYCPLCDMALEARNEALPCLHWLFIPYCRAERVRPVLATFGAVEAVRYLLIRALSEVRRPSTEYLGGAQDGGRTEIVIALRKRSWAVVITGERDATFTYQHRRTGFRFDLPLALRDGDAAVLRELSRFHDGGVSLWDRTASFA